VVEIPSETRFRRPLSMNTEKWSVVEKARESPRLQSGPMRRIALINQKGGVGKTTTAANLGAALALEGKRVLVADLDPQANLTLYLGVEVPEGGPSSYRVLTGELALGAALVSTATPRLQLLPTDIDLSGAELELSAVEGREHLLRRAIDTWSAEERERTGSDPVDYVLFDCPPSLGLLSLNALAASEEVFLVVQTEFLALQGLSKLVEVIELVKRRLHPGLRITGIIPCLYDSRLRFAREVLAELRRFFPEQVFQQAIGSNVKLAESPSFGKTIFEYAPESNGARDYGALAREVLAQEAVLRPQPPAPEVAPVAAPAATAAEPAPAVEATPAPPRRSRRKAEPAP